MPHPIYCSCGLRYEQIGRMPRPSPHNGFPLKFSRQDDHKSVINKNLGHIFLGQNNRTSPLQLLPKFLQQNFYSNMP